jgi:GntR family transcriptional regulator of arabinose operon
MAKRTVPKYLELKQEIINWIHSGQFAPGDQIPTEHEIAATFSVSRHTVRQAISELVHERWLYREQGRGTFLSTISRTGDRLANEPSHVIGVITTYISDYIFPSIIRGIEKTLSPQGYSILLLSTHNDFDMEAKALQTILDKNVDGIIVEPTKSAHQNPNIKQYFSLMENNIPFVMLHTSYEELCVPSVRIDDAEAARTITQFLIDLGHQRLGGVFKSDDMQGKLRLKGFMQAIQKNHLPIIADSVGLYTTENRYDIAREYVNALATAHDDKRPTGIVCYNDEISMDVISHLRNIGFRIPEDISVVSFDDSHWAEAGEVKLTSVEHPKFEMGVKSAELILKEIERIKLGTNEAAQDFVFPTRIVYRTSASQPQN